MESLHIQFVVDNDVYESGRATVSNFKARPRTISNTSSNQKEHRLARTGRQQMRQASTLLYREMRFCRELLLNLYAALANSSEWVLDRLPHFAALPPNGSQAGISTAEPQDYPSGMVLNWSQTAREALIQHHVLTKLRGLSGGFCEWRGGYRFFRRAMMRKGLFLVLTR